MVPTMTVTADYQDKTVLKGLSNVGGLMTSLSGIVAFLFGGSLLYHLLGNVDEIICSFTTILTGIPQ